MSSLPDLSTIVLTTAVLGISWHFVRQWLSPGRCTSKALLHGKTVVITGANTGIGKEAARDFVRRGARVIMACRSEERGKAAAKDIESDSRGELVVRQLDLASLKSIRKFADEIISTEERLDILINNAGVFCAKARTEDGFDMQFGTNHLGHFLLTYLLQKKLKKSAPSRIVTVSSRLHQFGKLHWEDLNLQQPNSYTALKAYGQSKLANILFTRELARRLKGTGVNSYALHPGRVRTEITRDFSAAVPTMTGSLINFAFKWVPYFAKTCEEGAQTTIYCAVAEELANQSGMYYSDCALMTPSPDARDDQAAKKLWEISMKLVGVQK